MKEIKYQDIKNRCAIWSTEKTVFGIGNLNANILLIGEAPGESEIKQGKPFVGKAGQNLNEFLKIVELDRKDLYITNVVKIRPTKISDHGNIINRPPNDDEILKYSKYLFQEIALVKPQLIVTLGGVAYKTVTSKRNASISRDHGKNIMVKLNDSNYMLFPLYHPASIIYKQELKDEYINDLHKLKDFVRKKVYE
jgi:DNA polymerase